jgi:hypothetical protein
MAIKFGITALEALPAFAVGRIQATPETRMLQQFLQGLVHRFPP